MGQAPSYFLVPASGAYCIEPSANRSQCYTKTFNGGEQQRWAMEPAANGTVHFRQLSSGKYLHASGARDKSNVGVGEKQAWKLERGSAPDTFWVKCVENGAYLCNSFANHKENNLIWMWQSNLMYWEQSMLWYLPDARLWAQKRDSNPSEDFASADAAPPGSKQAEAEAKEKDNALAEAREKLEARDKELKEKEAATEKKQSDLESREKELASKEESWAGQQRDFAARQKAFTAKQQQLETREKALAEKESSSSSSKKGAKETETQVADLQRQLNDAQQQLEEARTAEHSSSSKATAVGETAAKSVKGKDEEVARLRQQVASFEAEKKDGDGEMATLRQRVQELEAQQAHPYEDGDIDSPQDDRDARAAPGSRSLAERAAVGDRWAPPDMTTGNTDWDAKRKLKPREKTAPREPMEMPTEFTSLPRLPDGNRRADSKGKQRESITIPKDFTSVPRLPEGERGTPSGKPAPREEMVMPTEFTSVPRLPEENRRAGTKGKQRERIMIPTEFTSVPRLPEGQRRAPKGKSAPRERMEIPKEFTSVPRLPEGRMKA